MEEESGKVSSLLLLYISHRSNFQGVGHSNGLGGINMEIRTKLHRYVMEVIDNHVVLFASFVWGNLLLYKISHSQYCPSIHTGGWDHIVGGPTKNSRS